MNAHIQPFDDGIWTAKIQAFKDCIAAIRLQHETSMQRYPAPKVIEAAHAKRQPPKQMTFVYLLPVGVSREPAATSMSRNYVAPLWASMNESEGKKAA